MIPRRIIQTGPPEAPLLLRSAMAGVKLLHPEFEYLFFEDGDIEKFLAVHFPEHQKTYHSFRHRIQRYDFFRYLAVFHYGGFYLDQDVFLARALTPLLGYDCVFPFEELSPITFLWERFRMDWQIGNYAFGAVPGHPFLAAVIENCVRAQQDASWVRPMMKGIPRPFWPQFHVLNTSGPGLVSRTLIECGGGVGKVEVLFPDDVRNPATWHQVGDFGVHHMIGSWRGKSGFLKQRLLRLWDGRTLKRLLAEAKDRGKNRTLPYSEGGGTPGKRRMLCTQAD